MSDLFGLWEHQEKAVAAIETDWKSGFKSVCLQMPTGSGKCFGLGTKIILFDGTIKNVEDINQGDKLLGPDGEVRIVHDLSRGIDELYKIIPTKGDSFIVNKNHILSLYITPTNKNERLYLNDKVFYDNDIANIPLSEYLLSTKTFKHRSKIYRSKEISFKNSIKEKHLLIDPYFLGIWLGDGDSRDQTITSADFEIIKYIKEYSKKIGCKTNVWKSRGCYRIRINEKIKIKYSSILNSLRDYNLINNKHIPYEYLTASLDVRKKILAGIVDSDGHYSMSGFEITLKSENLIDDIIFLCRSIGLSCYKKKVFKKCCNNGVIGEYFRINISGELSSIPCLLERKKAKKRIQKKNNLVTGFTVEKVGIGEYFGFSVEGSDELFLLSDFTVVHNSRVVRQIVDNHYESKKVIYLIAHRDTLVKQLSDEISEAGIKHGIIRPNAPMLKYRVQVCSMQTLVRRLDKLPEPDIIIIDECHHSLSASYLKILEKWNGAKILGVTATPERLSGEPLANVFQKLITVTDIPTLIDQKRLSPFDYFAPETIDISGAHSQNGDYKISDIAEKVDKKSICGSAVEHYKRHADKRPAIVCCANIKHAENVAAEFILNGYRAVAVHSKMKGVEDAINGLKTGSLDVLCQCDLLSEGVDIKGAEVLIMLRHTKSIVIFLQQVGRVLRYMLGKKAIILDHVGNWERHGLPDDFREWSLFGKSKVKEVSEHKRCPDCQRPVKRTERICPHCGHSWVESLQKGTRELPEQIEGTLVQITESRKLKNAAVLAIVRNAKSLSEAVNIGKKHGISSKYAWFVWVKMMKKSA